MERGVGYVERSVLEARTVSDRADLIALLPHWLATVANQRVHGTTKAVPAVRHAEELAELRAASTVRPLDVRPIEQRVVGLDCHVSYRGVRYSVLPVAAGHTVTIRSDGEALGDRFTVHLGDRLVATHTRRPTGTPDVTLPEHRAAVQALTRGQSASARRPGQHRPHFVQVPLRAEGDALTAAEAARTTLAAIQRLAPAVDVRDLAQYEVLAAMSMSTGAAA